MYAAILSFLSAFATRAFIYACLFRILVGLGAATVAYLGILLAISQIGSAISANVGSTGAAVLVILHRAAVDKAVSVVLSAVVVRMTLNGLTASGVLRRITWASNGPIVLS
jgi:hypothetical protein